MDPKPQRTCTRCHQTDDHPRHVVGALNGGQRANFHMDCHAQLGCPVCLHQLADAGGAQGAELFTHLRSLAPLDPNQVAALLGQATPTSVED